MHTKSQSPLSSDKPLLNWILSIRDLIILLQCSTRSTVSRFYHPWLSAHLVIYLLSSVPLCNVSLESCLMNLRSHLTKRIFHLFWFCFDTVISQAQLFEQHHVVERGAQRSDKSSRGNPSLLAWKNSSKLGASCKIGCFGDGVSLHVSKAHGSVSVAI